jgi:hypothetical protein
MDRAGGLGGGATTSRYRRVMVERIVELLPGIREGEAGR